MSNYESDSGRMSCLTELCAGLPQGAVGGAAVQGALRRNRRAASTRSEQLPLGLGAGPRAARRECAHALLKRRRNPKL